MQASAVSRSTRTSSPAPVKNTTFVDDRAAVIKGFAVDEAEKENTADINYEKTTSTIVSEAEATPTTQAPTPRCRHPWIWAFALLMVGLALLVQQTPRLSEAAAQLDFAYLRMQIGKHTSIPADSNANTTAWEISKDEPVRADSDASTTARESSKNEAVAL